MEHCPQKSDICVRGGHLAFVKVLLLLGTWPDLIIGDGPNTVSESTVSITELTEFFWAH